MLIDNEDFFSFSKTKLTCKRKKEITSSNAISQT